MSHPDERLHDLLGADPPPSVLALDPDRRAALAGLLREARARQTQALEESFTATLRHLPFPLRGVAKKVLLG